ncbi:hypothetical protein CO058_03430 [candidate division WWE3 bacterium CG_4_9_14_0_2_um_filter_35_11]|uniref:PIN domain-containing protein n=1 Tax=candidate division WWE3 bacterium CG_4_9_14_0_2_um_filter_35_11 TaxID=1975077 RepID=A0A2M8EL49_UNCKA|nr:MAG: hypothetical protein COV25_00825 [candidate division WWE3 bacterium CG10_big_fil_rev_8_21_14_0_10_35_32]PJC23459.1 MAG: hypothetical protein CO058_03430 [candidate division WWE3 bacterium CG_4_9_14_0_2_um_filter_35_11]
MKRMRVFLDSDVVISSMMSKEGASRILTSGNGLFLPVISDFSLQEIMKVSERLHISKSIFEQVINSIKVIKTNHSLENFKKEFSKYVLDINDVHIIGSAVNLNVGFLITFNLKHYKQEDIKADLKIITITPGSFLQYIRGVKQG